MFRLALLFTVFFALNATAKTNNGSYYLNIDSIDVSCEENELEQIVFASIEDSTFENFDINSIEVIEIEDEVELNFNPKDYLPEGFNALKGKHDLDWSTIELVGLEEEVEFEFNPKDYLPENFNAIKGKHDLDWSTIELIELEEEIEFDFDPKDYLPNNFDPNKGIHSNNILVCL